MRALIASTALALTLAVAGPALAQQQQEQQQATQQAKVSPDAHAVMDKEIMSDQGKKLGKVKDVLIGQDGKVQALVVDHNRKDRAVPWDQVSMQGEQMTVQMTDQQMSQLPEYKASKD